MDALTKVVKSIPVMALPPKTIQQLQDEAQSRDILWCLESMSEWEDFITNVYGRKGEP